ncbi:PREDICTED: uncharacterized protein LOC107353798 [Acropora digitifera]|uniref:uncharacterized protein LOC107353798 n=1 Tax=Acropora digitifera TaxID=70779 RepID=UPI00077AFEFD|nr:PREDICTED: uncharacterized protein LOC107353798 [Acropora digitifera]
MHVVDLTITSDEKGSDEKLNIELSSLFFFSLSACVVDLTINSDSSDDDLLSSAWDHTKDAQVVVRVSSSEDSSPAKPASSHGKRKMCGSVSKRKLFVAEDDEKEDNTCCSYSNSSETAASLPGLV